MSPRAGSLPHRGARYGSRHPHSHPKVAQKNTGYIGTDSVLQDILHSCMDIVTASVLQEHVTASVPIVSNLYSGNNCLYIKPLPSRSTGKQLTGYFDSLFFKI